ncbi:MAG TPA: SpvB/TcaC N-terminal domain-containing protein [Candidatus Angelobacter sp.]|nr:SpvB/TcaC N-terminal domain-containing protein [Candidatus Angelobacter sp.]
MTLDPQGRSDGGREAGSRFRIEAPQVSMPKGGGAIGGIGEKFAANPVTGTGSLSVPIYSTAGRSSFGPQLSLAYDSGSGNGPFGFGWSLTLPSITRKTDKGLPQYDDAHESDTFILSGAEDLVPALTPSQTGWDREIVPGRIAFGPDGKQHNYDIHRYRPRTEGLFSRIERWVNTTDPEDTFWRTISKDNVTAWYGKTAASRIADPLDASRIFNWLICESYDDKGNAVSYRYKTEDSTGVDLQLASERNRTGSSRTVKQYLKSIFYGNRTPYFPSISQAAPVLPPDTDWCFQVVFDYGEHDLANPTPQDAGQWSRRADSFSTYRATFEVRTYRLCRRVLMFHHFEKEAGVGVNCLVRSTDFVHAQPAGDPIRPFYSFLLSVAQTGYRRDGKGGYIHASMPPLEFEYTDAEIDEGVRDIDSLSLENLPYGLDGSHYRWTDLDGEGLKGILTEQAGAWFYKANLSAANLKTENGSTLTLPQFSAVQVVGSLPSLAGLVRGQQLMDLSGDGKLDLVDFDTPAPGYFERSDDAAWRPFRSFEILPVLDWKDPNLKFIDLTGDGLADLLITQDNAICWHESLGSQGFDVEHRVPQSADEELGPKLVFADGTETIFLADLSGDGLTDLVRIRNGEVCYWPNLGYGRFGIKIAMDQSPRFDRPECFDARRIRLADIDGSGTTDIIYFAETEIHLYFNQSGNGWGSRRVLDDYPPVESLSTATVLDLLGNGTACLLWSSPLPGNTRRPMRYIDLMSGQKPHLLTRVKNNLGTETTIQYAPSTKFYVADKLADTPWVTKLPFPVHVVEQVITYDYVSRSLFASRYAYHHGYFDGVEREFRGFGRVDQWDTEQFATLAGTADFPRPVNLDASSHVPPVCTKTWYHTGAFFEEAEISRHLAHEYYSEGDAAQHFAGLSDAQTKAMLLDDTVLPTDILLTDGSRVAHDFSGEELREACRALRGSLLRQEIYALDDTAEADRPYSASERNYTLEALQPQGPNRYGVFAAHPRETLDFRYERKLYKVLGNSLADAAAPPAKPAADPRVAHAVTLSADPFGNALQSVSIAYGRRYVDPDLTARDQQKQATSLITFTENAYTLPVQGDDAWRTPLPAETKAYELLQLPPAANLADVTNLFQFDVLQTLTQAAGDGVHDLAFEDLNPARLNAGEPYRRITGHSRTLYRPDDLGAAAGDPRALLPVRHMESRALTGESYKLVFTPGLIAQVYQRDGNALLPDPATVLTSKAGDGGGYVDLDRDGNFWAPFGREFYISGPPASPAELNQALQTFFLPRRFEDPFGNATQVDYDPYGLLITRTTDAANNQAVAQSDYRVIAASLITDPNGNQSAVEFDALGLVTATAIMGKPGEKKGDLLTGYSADLAQGDTDNFYEAADPHTLAAPLIGNATTRVVYDLNAFYNSRAKAPADPSQWMPSFSATIAREIHHFDLQDGQKSNLQITFSYSDGFGREIQKKIQAEAGPVTDSGPVVNPRWAASSWVINNNKGKPVRKYEPFFSRLAAGHKFEFGVTAGVSPIICYDPAERIVATLHPNHTYEKAVFDPWGQATWDVNDTVAQDDPTTDPDVGDYFQRLPSADYAPTWRVQRAAGGLGPLEQAAAIKAAAHADTPTVAYFDTLGRTFLTLADNGALGRYPVRVQLDIQSFQRAIVDPLGRTIASSDYTLPGQKIHQASMEAGGRWILNDATDKPIRAWDTRGHNLRTEYDALRRTVHLFVLGTNAANSDPRTTTGEVMFEKIEYGESQPSDQALNLRTRVFRHRDNAGIVLNAVTDPETALTSAYDFKGNLLASSRQFTQDYKQLPDWSLPDPPFLADLLINRTEYDALNRATAATVPDGSVVRPTYNPASLLQSVDVNLQGAAVSTTFVDNVDYDAKGQRVSISYGSHSAPVANTAYSYDPLTLRLAALNTTRPGFPAGQQPAQDLSYTYDPAGNITHIEDAAQQTVYFANRKVEPSTDYTYDAIYRLVQANGREHLGLNGGAPSRPWPSNYNDVPRIQLAHPGDGNALGTYTEQYQYDDAGNFLKLIHTGNNAADPGWARAYTYQEASLLEPGKVSNRLTSTNVSGSVPWVENYQHDTNGNMTAMPQLQALTWDFKDRLQMTRRQAVNADDADGALQQGRRTYYVYGAGGERVRKVTESAAGVKIKERLYVGVAEIYREFNGAGNATLERGTLNVMDNKRRIALVETLKGAKGVIRYQFDNHLGTACLELDNTGAVITYEEYYPFGSTSYQAGRSAAEVSLKRYRYTGKERDEETGFNYHGVRYFMPWIARWISCDPAGTGDGPNLYQYVRSNPVKLIDSNGSDSTTPQPELVSPKTEFMFHPLANLHFRLNANSSRVTLAFVGRTQFANNKLITKKDPINGGPITSIGSGAYLNSGYLSLDTRLGSLSVGADVSLDRHFTGLGSMPADYRLQATFFPVFRDSKSGYELLRFSGSAKETLYGVEFSGNLHTGPLPKTVDDYSRLATGLIDSFSSGKSIGDKLTKFATRSVGVELSFSAKLKLLNTVPITWINGHVGADTGVTAYGIVPAPAGALFPVTTPLVGLYKTYSKDDKSFEFLGGALVVPSIEAITKGEGGLQAFPTYGFLRSSVSTKVGPGHLKLSVEGALSAKELTSPTPLSLDFNQTYDIIHGAQPEIPAAYKGTATLSYTY